MLTGVRDWVIHHPMLSGMAVLAAGMVIRLLDIFVFRLDERWGEIILSKTLLCLLVLAFLLATGAGFSAIGLKREGAVSSALLGLLVTALALACGYVAELVVLHGRGLQGRLELAAMDPKTGLSGAATFAAFLLAGNIINSLAEEGLFRGLLPLLFATRMGPLTALALSAVLFGAWHLPWAAKALLEGGETNVPLVLVSNFVPQVLLGLVWGYLYVRTGNLWACLVSHTLVNSAVNFLHVRAGGMLDEALPTRMGVFTAVMLAGVLALGLLDGAARPMWNQPWLRRG
jgi:membrane protease YdiL (CAAX protease family)